MVRVLALRYSKDPRFDFNNEKTAGGTIVARRDATRCDATLLSLSREPAQTIDIPWSLVFALARRKNVFSLRPPFLAVALPLFFFFYNATSNAIFYSLSFAVRYAIARCPPRTSSFRNFLPRRNREALNLADYLAEALPIINIQLRWNDRG